MNHSPSSTSHGAADPDVPKSIAGAHRGGGGAGVLAPILTGTLGACMISAGSFGAGAQAGEIGLAGNDALAFLAIGSGAVASMILVWLGVILCCIAWLALGKAVASGTAVRWWVVFAAWAIPLLPALPVFSGDAWTYLAQGEMLSGPADPYVDGTGAAGGAMSANVHPDWRFTPTPYGPLHLLIMQGTAALSGHSAWPAIIGLRVVVFAFLALAAVALSRLARLTGASRDHALWLGVANPLVVVHLVGGLHNDAIILAFALLGMWLSVAAAAAAPPRLRWGLLAGAGVAIGLAGTIKVTSLLLLPFLAWIAGRAFFRAFARGVWMTAFAAVTGAIVTLASGAGIGWMDALSVSDRVVYWIALPTAGAHLADWIGVSSFENALAIARTLCMVAGALMLAVCWWLARPVASERDNLDTLRSRTGGIFAWLTIAWTAFFVVNVLSWPWYWTVAVGTLAAIPATYRGAHQARALAVAIIVFQLLATDPGGTPTLYNPFFTAAAVIAAVAAALWTRRAVAFTRRDAPPRTATKN